MFRGPSCYVCQQLESYRRFSTKECNTCFINFFPVPILKFCPLSGGQKNTMCTTLYLSESNNEFDTIGKTLNLKVESPTVKAFKLKYGKDLFPFAFEIRCKKAKS